MKKLTKRVQAGGLWFDVPVNINYVAFSHTGDVYCYLKEPPKPVSDWKKSMFHPCGFVSLEGADWRECCWYVGDQVDGEAEEQPVAWTDEEELRDLKSYGFCEMFSVEPISKDADMRRVIPLYRHDKLSLTERREWMARGVESLENIASEYCDTDCIMDRHGISYEDAELRANGAQELAGEIAAYADKIRSGEVDL